MQNNTPICGILKSGGTFVAKNEILKMSNKFIEEKDSLGVVASCPLLATCLKTENVLSWQYIET